MCTRYIKISVIQILAIVGIALGYYIAPARPIYPFVASGIEYSFIIYREFHILFVVGLFASICAFLSGSILKTSPAISFICSLVSGGVLAAGSALRVGSIYGAFPTYSIAFIIGVFCTLGIYSVLVYVVGIYAKFRT